MAEIELRIPDEFLKAKDGCRLKLLEEKICTQYINKINLEQNMRASMK